MSRKHLLINVTGSHEDVVETSSLGVSNVADRDLRLRKTVWHNCYMKRKPYMHTYVPL